MGHPLKSSGWSIMDRGTIYHPPSTIHSASLHLILRHLAEYAAVFFGDGGQDVDEFLVVVTLADEGDRVDLYRVLFVEVAHAREHRIVVREIAVGQQEDQLRFHFERQL